MSAQAPAYRPTSFRGVEELDCAIRALREAVYSSKGKGMITDSWASRLGRYCTSPPWACLQPAFRDCQDEGAGRWLARRKRPG
jgi:hypothetical protein